MSPEEARLILESLAMGIDPITGEALSAESRLHSPDVIRALFLGARALEGHVAPSPQRPAAGSAWSRADEQRLVDGFDQNVSTETLALQLGRTREAILARLVRLGKAPSRAALRRAANGTGAAVATGGAETDDPEAGDG